MVVTLEYAHEGCSGAGDSQIYAFTVPVGYPLTECPGCGIPWKEIVASMQETAGLVERFEASGHAGGVER